MDGDYFGGVVNLAARLGALAGSGVIMASASMGEVLSEHEAWSVEWLEPQAIRGIPDPVTACQIRRRR